MDDKLFFKVYRDKEIQFKIYSFISTSYGLSCKKYNYYEITDAGLMATNKGLRNLLKYRVENGDNLNFNFTQNQIPFYQIFSNLNQDNDIETIKFYSNLFKNYSNYFLSSIDLTARYLVESNCLVGLKVLIDEYNFNPVKNYNQENESQDGNEEDEYESYEGNYFQSILFGSIKVSNYLKEMYGTSDIVNLNNGQFEMLWNSLLLLKENKQQQQQQQQGMYIDSIKYLNSIGAPLPSDELIGKLNCLFEFDINKVNLQFILDICYSIEYLSSKLQSNSIFNKRIQDNKEIQILTKQQLDSIKSKLTLDQLLSNLNDLNSDDDDDDEIISKLVGMSIIFTDINLLSNLSFFLLKYHNGTGNGKSEQAQLFKWCKNDKSKQIKWVKDSVVGNTSNKQKIQDTLELLIEFNDLELIKLFINDIESSISLSTSNYLDLTQIYSLIKSPEIFDFIYSTFKNYSFNFSNYLIQWNQSMDKTNNNDRLNIICNHFKINYPNDYYESIEKEDFQINQLLKVDFIFNNLNDFKKYIPQIWSISINISPSITLDNFKKLLNNTPIDQKYHSMNSTSILEWIIQYRKYDIDNGRFNINGSLSNKLKSHLYYPKCGSLDKLKLILSINNEKERLNIFNSLSDNNEIDTMICIGDFICLEFIFQNISTIGLGIGTTTMTTTTTTTTTTTIKSSIIKQIILSILKYNRVDVLAFIYTYFPKLLTNVEYQLLFELSISLYGSLEILEYLQIMGYKPIGLEDIDLSNTNTDIIINYIFNTPPPQTI